MSNELLSIIIPVYNVEKYLKNCLDSVINQTYKNLEIILVNDGSTDNCAKICDAYKDNNKQIKVIHKQNGGLSDARNVGILQATGRYIGFVDSDDTIDKEMYDILLSNLKNNNADISICNFYFVRENHKIQQSFSNQIKLKNKEEALDDLYNNSKFGNFVWNKLYKKELFNNIKFPIKKKYEDIWIMHELFAQAQNITYIDKPLYYYYERSNSIIGEESIQTSIDYFDGMIKRANSHTTQGREKFIASTLLNRTLKSQKQIFNKNIEETLRQQLKEKCDFCIENYCHDKYLNAEQIKLKNKCINNPKYFAIKYNFRTRIRKSKNPLLKKISNTYIKKLS